MGYLKREEFTRGIEALGVNDITSLKSTLKTVEKETLATPAAFTDLYKVVFFNFYFYF